MTRRHEVRVDVSDAVGTGEQLTVAARVLLPDDIAVESRGRTVLVGYPGGGYTRHYYHLHIPGHAGYSEAEFHVAAGRVVVAIDHLAAGGSDVPQVPLDFDAVARADAHAADEIVGQLQAGAQAADLPPVEVAATAAVGQSFGGFLLIIAQGSAPSFDGIGVLAAAPGTHKPRGLTTSPSTTC